MTTTVTKESLAARIAELESGARSLKEDYTLAAYKMLLATMEAEPVAWEYEWASYITCGGPQDFEHIIELEAPPEWAIEKGLARSIIPLYRHAQTAPVVSADLLHTAASAIEDLLTTKDRTGAGVWFDLPFRLRSAANAQPAPVVPEDWTIADAVKFCKETGRQDAGAAMDAWNACRAAMLNGGKS